MLKNINQNKNFRYNNVFINFYKIIKLFSLRRRRHISNKGFFMMRYSTPIVGLNNNNFRFKVPIKKTVKPMRYFKNKLYSMRNHILFKKLSYRSYRTHKTKFIHNLKNILRNRRLLRHFFTITKVKSNYLTKIITKITHMNLPGRINFLTSSVGFVLLRSHLLFSLIDSYWYSENGFINLNSKPCLNFFCNLNKGDVISVDNYYLKSFFLRYYKFKYFKWLRRRSRKTRSIVKKYAYHNKSLKNNVLNRWMLLYKMFNSINSDFHCEYKTGLILYLGLDNLVRVKNSRNFFLMLSSNMFSFNNWHYNH